MIRHCIATNFLKGSTSPMKWKPQKREMVERDNTHVSCQAQPNSLNRRVDIHRQTAPNTQNRQNLLPKGSPRVVNVGRAHFPQSLIEWAGISGLGKNKLVLIQEEVMFNVEIYRKQILKGVVIPRALENAEDIDWTFHQDWTPPFIAEKTLQWCETNLPDL